jgi:hypothetical protein
LASCSNHRVIPDHRIPHQLSRPCDAYQWVRRQDGTLQEEPVRIPEGWWVASPQVVDEEGP